MEVERKFLVKDASIIAIASLKRRIIQGYLCSDAARSVRVRICEDEAFLTIKGATNERGWSRYEFEQPIPLVDAEELIKLCLPSLIEKDRYEVSNKDHTWEVDVFHGANEGLIMAEIELSSEDETFDLPEWVGREVSGNANYYNAQLATNPFSNWNELARAVATPYW